MVRTLEDVERDIASAVASGDIKLHRDLLLEQRQLEGEERQRQYRKLKAQLMYLKGVLEATMEARTVRAAQSPEGRTEEWYVREFNAYSAELKSELKEVVREHFRSQNSEEERASWRFRDLFKFGKKKPSPPPLQPAT